MRRALLAVAVAAVVLAGCGGDDDGGSTCDEVFAAGQMTTKEFEEGADCLDPEGDPTIVLSATIDCDDGRTLLWNDYGAGFIGEAWRPDAADVNGPEAVQMREDCTG